MKAVIPLLAGVIVCFLVVLAALAPLYLLQIHIERQVLILTRSFDAQTLLMTILSTTVNENGREKKMSEIIAEYIVLDESQKPDVEGLLKTKLDELVKSGEYKLYYEDNGEVKTIVSSGNPSFQEAKAKIHLPCSSELFKEITLVIN